MVAPKKTGGTTRNPPPSRVPEYRAARHQEQRRQRDPLPGATPCEVCGIPIEKFGTGAHRRQHILRGDLPEPEGFERGREPTGRRHIPDLPAPTRAQRNKFVTRIAKLPYREFIKELLEPWDHSSI